LEKSQLEKETNFKQLESDLQVEILKLKTSNDENTLKIRTITEENSKSYEALMNQLQFEIETKR
jgi:serine protease inhibitor ecotin